MRHALLTLSLLCSSVSLASPQPPVHAEDAPARGHLVTAAGRGSATPIQLISVGEEPLQTLRFAPLLGQAEARDSLLTLTTKSVVSEDPAIEMVVPDLAATFSVEVVEVLPNGEFRWRFSHTPHAPDDSDKAGAAMRRALDATRPLHGEGRSDAQGRTLSLSWETGPGSTAALADLREQLGVLLPALPNEPVGVGGRWQTTQRLLRRGLDVDQHTTWTVESIHDHEVRLSFDFTQQLATVAGPLPGMMPGADATLTYLTGAGSGELVVSTAHVLPLSARCASELEIQVDVQVGAVKVPAQTNVNTTWSLADAPQGTTAPTGAAPQPAGH